MSAKIPIVEYLLLYAKYIQGSNSKIADEHKNFSIE